MDEQKLRELHAFKERTKEEIAEIDQWIRQTPNTAFPFQIRDGPIFWFRRFSDADYRAIEARLPKTEEEAHEQAKSPELNEKAREACAGDLEKYSADKILQATWLQMDGRDMFGLWAALIEVSRKREEQI